MAGLISEPETSVEPEEVAELVYVRGDDGSYRGWKTELLAEQITDKILAKFLLCSYCSGVSRDACFFEKNDRQQLACSLCIPKETKNQIAQMNRESINEKQVNCPLRVKGCDWTKELSEVLRHLEECELFPVACPLGCRDERGEVSRVERRGVETHMTCCPMRTVNCEYCNRKVKSYKMNPHLELCEEFPISCPNKCGEEVRLKRKDELNHLNQECPLQETECPYSPYGCGVRVERRHLDKHEKEDIHEHLKLTMLHNINTETQLKLIMANNNLTIKNVHNKITKLEKENETFRKLLPRGSMECEIKDVRIKIRREHTYYSDPFYVGLYKFQGYIEWNREDDHVGYFIHIMKGEWDDTLKWPIRYKYTVKLINHIDTENNYEKVGKVTDEHLQTFPECFQKPKSDRNRSLGYPKFMSHDQLLQDKYCKEDSIKLTIFVEQMLV